MKRKVLLGFFLGAETLLALPSGGIVVSGEAAIGQENEQSMRIEAKDRSIIEWSSFSIASQEKVEFFQSSIQSAVLNRVVGADPTSIWGKLESNGSVYLINENGIVFGPGCVIDAGSFAASTLDLLDADFIAGRDLFFQGDSQASIVHLGTIQAHEGPVALLAHRIENRGKISAPGGAVALGAGHEILLQPEKSPLLYIVAGHAEGISFDGEVSGLRAELQAGMHPHSLGIQINGSVDALEVESKGGVVFLRAQEGPLTVGSAGRIRAVGGSIEISAVSGQENVGAQPPIVSSGTIEAEGGRIEISGAKFLNAGKMAVGQGTLSIRTEGAYLDTESSSIQAGGGRIDIDAGFSFFSSGKVSAEKGNLSIRSDLVRLAGNSVEAKGGRIEISSFHPVEMNEFSTLKAGSIQLKAEGRKEQFNGILTLAALPLIGESGGQTCVCPIYEFVDPHPSGVAAAPLPTKANALPNGNVVIAKPSDSFGASESGSVFLYNGANQALISFLYGGSANDHVGSGEVQILQSGHYVVASPEWRNPVTMANLAGAATWRDSAGTATELVAVTNSIVGSAASDRVSISGVYAFTNGHAAIGSNTWNGFTGAATWMNGFDGTDATGVFAPVTAGVNSITGSAMGDGIAGQGILPSKNGNGVIISISWNGSRGAATWINGTTGQDGTGAFGTVGAGNSLVGTNPTDQVGSAPAALEDPVNGHFIIGSSFWNGFTGAATWMNGTNGTDGLGMYGAVSAANSIVGAAMNEFCGTVYPMKNGHALMTTVNWNTMTGAVTWMNGTNGTDVNGMYGPVTALNSLTGAAMGDQIGTGGIAILTTGNGIMGSPSWNSMTGAVTWINGADGTDFFGVRGTVTALNSVTGSAAGDQAGATMIALANGNAVAGNFFWNGNRGCSTWINGADGTDALGGYNTVTAANSITGTLTTDFVGPAIPLADGDYVLYTPSWNDNIGAVCWVNGSTGRDALGQFGPVSSANSLVGTIGGMSGDQIGNEIVALPNGDFVVYSMLWNANTGALTLGNGIDGSYCGGFGEVDSRNSILGPAPNSNLQTTNNLILVDAANQNFLFTFSDYNGQTRVFASSYLGCYTPIASLASLARRDHEYLIAISEAFVKCSYNSLGGYLEQDLFPPLDTNKQMSIPIPSLVSFEMPDLPKIGPDLNPPWNTNL